MKHLARIPSLHSLTLFDTKITDEGLQHLAELKNLKVIAIRGSNITKAGVAELQKTLPAVRVIGAK